MKVWLLIRLEDDYDSADEIVAAYATMELAKAAAEAQCAEVKRPWTTVAYVDHPTEELLGRLLVEPDPPGVYNGWHMKPRDYFWTVTELEVITPPPAPVAPPAVADRGAGSAAASTSS